MEREIRVPDIGEFDEVEIVEILVSSGDTVESDESLVTLESDKASMDIPAPAAGTIVRVGVKVGDLVGEGDLIATIEVPEESEVEAPVARQAASVDAGVEAAEEVPVPVVAPGSSTTPSEEVRPGPVAPGVASSEGRLPHAGPSVRRFARELGVDLTLVAGSGRKGRITRDDVKAYVKATLTSAPAAEPAIPVVPTIDFSRFGEIEEVALSRIRRRSKDNLHRSWLNVPHVTQFDDADITDLEAYRRSQAEEAKKRGTKLSILPFLMKAVVDALLEHPRLNSSLAPGGEALIFKKYFHLGIAVDTEEGLVVPVIRDVDQKGLFEIAEELAGVSSRARKGKLRMQDIQGSCFTISSLGGIGGTAFTPIVNAPEVAILGVSRSRWQPVYDGEQFSPRLSLPLSLSYDHRVVDGAEAVRFTTYLAGLLADVERFR